MNSYRYRVTVEQVADAKGQRFADGRRLVFEAPCHDEILQLVERVQTRRVLPTSDEAAAVLVGLKLLGEVALARRKEPLFAEVHAALGQFLEQLKAAGRGPAAPGSGPGREASSAAG